MRETKKGRRVMMTREKGRQEKGEESDDDKRKSEEVRETRERRGV